MQDRKPQGMVVRTLLLGYNERMESDSVQKYRVVKPELEGTLDELKAREPIFHREEFGRSRKDFENMMVADYWEVGASGNRYGRDLILDTLDERCASEYKEDWETSDFSVRELSKDLYLLTYTLIQEGKRKTRRSTIWQKIGSDWKIVYHQGTIIES